MVSAEELENQIKNLIVAERTSSTYEQEMRALLLGYEDLRVTARSEAKRAAQEVAALKVQRGEAVRLQMVASERGLDPEMYFGQLQQLQKQIRSAKQEQAEAECVAESAAPNWARAEGAIHEAENLAAIWDSLSV